MARGGMNESRQKAIGKPSVEKNIDESHPSWEIGE
jgi:hypothetical protein